MVAGEVFTFEPSALDDLCMNYDQVPVSLAVTASAAFPLRLHAGAAAEHLLPVLPRRAAAARQLGTMP
ncbi:MAG: hypothetical protein WDN69_05500 [Aliidongia sp.]